MGKCGKDYFVGSRVPTERCHFLNPCPLPKSTRTCSMHINHSTCMQSAYTASVANYNQINMSLVKYINGFFPAFFQACYHPFLPPPCLPLPLFTHLHLLPLPSVFLSFSLSSPTHSSDISQPGGDISANVPRSLPADSGQRGASKLPRGAGFSGSLLAGHAPAYAPHPKLPRNSGSGGDLRLHSLPRKYSTIII